MFNKLIVAAFTALTALAFNAWAAVDINRASRAELETVKGIGPGLSAKILEARKTSDFKSWADMVERVPGVGAASAGKLSKAGLTVNGAAFDASSLPAPKPQKGEKAAKAETAAKADAGSTEAKPARKAPKVGKEDKPAAAS
jgi:competence protein ComEA